MVTWRDPKIPPWDQFPGSRHTGLVYSAQPHWLLCYFLKNQKSLTAWDFCISCSLYLEHRTQQLCKRDLPLETPALTRPCKGSPRPPARILAPNRSLLHSVPLITTPSKSCLLSTHIISAAHRCRLCAGLTYCADSWIPGAQNRAWNFLSSQKVK